MSYHTIRVVRIEPNEVRDFFQPYAKTADFKVDTWQEFKAIGLDLLLHNRGAANITISIDKGQVITVEAGDSLPLSNIRYALVEVVAAVAYDLVLAGVFR